MQTIEKEKNVSFKNLIVFILAVLTVPLMADESLQDFPGSIPLDQERGVATDLVDAEGNPLFPEEALKYKDLSRLNPAASDIWAPTPMEQIPTVNLKSQGEELEWVGDITSAITWQTFLTKPANNEGSGQFFNILLSRKAHNVLMRARLLQKLGYRIPNIKYIKSFRLTFPSKALRDDFLNITMIDQLDALPSRWVKNAVKTTTDSSDDQPGQVVWKVTEETEGCYCLEIQDAVAFNSTTHIYNFPVGVLSQEVMQGRRAFEALLIPFGLTFVDESFNMLSWEFGKISNDRLFVSYEYNHQFFPNYSDAKWIARKILRLTRKDWEQVVAFGDYPLAVQKLAVEKFISRRNSLIRLFHLSEEFQPMQFNPQVSHSEMGVVQLRDGKLLQLEWPGYAPSFGFGDPESPLNNAELFGFLKSKVISNGINYLVGEFNNRFMPKTDVAARVAEKQYDLLLDALVESAINGTAAEIPFGYYVIPYAGVDLIASREIITGQIMGTENPIQISHTIGFSVNAGAYVGFHGLPSDLSLNGRLQGYITRTYSHLKPVTNIEAALKQPYKNIAVNFLAKDISETMERVYQGEFDNLKDMKGAKKKELETELVNVFSNFDNVFAVGESLILSDYVGAMGHVNFGIGLGELNLGGDINPSARAYIQAKGEMKLISRLHIFRKSKDVIQIYDDKGNVMSLSLSLGVDLAGVRFIGLDLFTNFNGSATTKYTQLNMTTDKNDRGELTNDKLVDNMKILYRLFNGFNKEGLYAKREPTILYHDFHERGFEYKLFWHEGKYVKSMNDVTVEYDGEVGHYIRTTRGFRSGNNWEGFGIDASNAVINELLVESDFNVSSQSGSDPGYTFRGKSRARRVVFEGRVHEDKLYSPYIMVEHRWRGWAADKEDIRDIIEEVNNTYPVGNDRPDYYRRWDLRDVTLLQLYSVYLNLNVYSAGLASLRDTPDNDVRAAFQRAANAMPSWEFNRGGNDSDIHSERDDWVRSKMSKYRWQKNKINRKLREGDLRKASEAFRDLFEHAEKYLLWEDLLRFLGGKDNVFIQSRINGFRKGDELINPDTGFHEPFISNSFGVLGDRQASGPMSFMRENLGMTEAEAFIYWIMENL